MTQTEVLTEHHGHLVEPDDTFSLRLSRTPDVIVKEAQLCANALMAAVRNNNWAIKFGGDNSKEHLYFEAWAFLANMYRVTARVKPDSTRLIQIGDVIGWEAYAEAFHVPSGIVISTADSMCLNDEDNWTDREKKEWVNENGKKFRKGTGEYVKVPLFQLRSMAQTRAMARALRAPFSWIIAMAGYAPRTAEEMTGNENEDAKSPNQPQEKKKTTGDASAKISGGKAGRIWAIGFSGGVDKKRIREIVKEHGFDDAADITNGKYDEICAAIEREGKSPNNNNAQQS